MAISNHEQVGRALNLLGKGLYPYVEQQMRAIYGNAWLSRAKSCLSEDSTLRRTIEETLREDVSALLKVMTKRWETVFKPELSYTERALASELIDVRNKWAHRVRLSTEDTYRALDSMTLLLGAIDATEKEAVAKQKQEVLRLLWQEQSRQETRKSQTSTEESPIREHLHELLKKIPFQDALLLYLALTHRSYIFENPTQTQGDNEQLEFLGDSVLEFLAGDYVFEQFPGRNEGELTKRRSNLVDNTQLAKFATELDLGRWIRLSKGEQLQGGRTKLSLLSNTFEAVIGAYYLDSGIEAVRELVEPLFDLVVEDAVSQDATPEILNDVKNRFQNWAQTNHQQIPKYPVTNEVGADHAKMFTVEVRVNGTVYGEGTANKKKEAEKQAASDALRKLGLL
ncbi:MULTISPECIES: ribonuclease III [unclassified Coleofasciculus]|uniref:ribonuclease III n=1 Tax=unclassified Coleofasciculus TaxID=2692782 RepID=UPI0018812901|nr:MULTISPECIES: ribonuclease III [unclassified Coleofasciculus]MBE9126393.1 ribonuclease III [Coleofasciculus sp. LEGE 07081]MBE9149828.1 ribonuclease III [Coleofasciculus sp. LEGE 07092]